MGASYVSLGIGWLASATDGQASLSIKEGGTTLGSTDGLMKTAGNGMHWGPVTAVVTPSAGSHTYKLTAAQTVGTGGVVMGATSTKPAWILVEDITGTLWPGSEITVGMVASEVWIDYTPTLTQNTAVTKTVTYARYQRVGRKITVEVYLDITGAGVATNGVVIGLPVTAAISGLPVPGTGFILDASAGRIYPGLTRLNTTIAMTLMPLNVQVTTGWDYLGLNGGVAAGTFAAALASGDVVAISAVYEAAS